MIIKIHDFHCLKRHIISKYSMKALALCFTSILFQVVAKLGSKRRLQDNSMKLKARDLLAGPQPASHLQARRHLFSFFSRCIMS